MPRPPPPATALSSAGRPQARTASITAAGSVRPAVSPGTVGMPSFAASRLAEALPPRRSMVSAVGPTKHSPAASTARTNSGFSETKP